VVVLLLFSFRVAIFPHQDALNHLFFDSSTVISLCRVKISEKTNRTSIIESAHASKINSFTTSYQRDPLLLLDGIWVNEQHLVIFPSCSFDLSLSLYPSDSSNLPSPISHPITKINQT